jgi:hypothetical protein
VSWSKRALSVVLSVVSVTWTFADTARAATPTSVVPYAADGYAYEEVPIGSGAPTFAAVDFDDSAFLVGAAPFGQNASSCSLSTSTAWSTNTDLLVRRHVPLPAGTNDVTIHIAIDNDITLFWNGTQIGSFVHEGCASSGSFTVHVPDALLATGDNVLAARARDRGGVSFLDLEVTANQPPDCRSIELDATVLWPPKHQMKTITAAGGSDPEGGAVTLAISEVTQDEPLDGVADGKTSPDANFAGLLPGQVALRVERAGTNDGRVYRVTVEASDADGASCSVTLVVGVARDQGAHPVPVDTVGVVVNSLGTDLDTESSAVPASNPANPPGPTAAAPAARPVGSPVPTGAGVTSLPPTTSLPTASLPPAPSLEPAPGQPPETIATRSNGTPSDHANPKSQDHSSRGARG